MKKLNQKGFHVLELTIFVCIILILSLVGWKVYKDKNKSPVASSSTVSSSSTSTPRPVSQNSVNSKQDLSGATNTLNSVGQENSQTTSDLNQIN